MNPLPSISIGNHVLPQRYVDTPDGHLAVPSHIYRAKNGWNVCIRRKDKTDYFSCYFSDNHYGGVQQALSQSLEKLYDEMPHHPTHNQLHPGHSHYYQVREYRPSDMNILVTRVQTYICSYRDKLRCISFYVGTENTKTDYKLRTAIDRAIGARCWSIDTIKAEGRHVLIDLPVPRNIEKYAY